MHNFQALVFYSLRSRQFDVFFKQVYLNSLNFAAFFSVYFSWEKPCCNNVQKKLSHFLYLNITRSSIIISSPNFEGLQGYSMIWSMVLGHNLLLNSLFRHFKAQFYLKLVKNFEKCGRATWVMRMDKLDPQFPVHLDKKKS